MYCKKYALSLLLISISARGNPPTEIESQAAKIKEGIREEISYEKGALCDHIKDIIKQEVKVVTTPPFIKQVMRQGIIPAYDSEFNSRGTIELRANNTTIARLQYLLSPYIPTGNRWLYRMKKSSITVYYTCSKPRLEIERKRKIKESLTYFFENCAAHFNDRTESIVDEARRWLDEEIERENVEESEASDEEASESGSNTDSTESVDILR